MSLFSWSGVIVFFFRIIVFVIFVIFVILCFFEYLSGCFLCLSMMVLIWVGIFCCVLLNWKFVVNVNINLVVVMVVLWWCLWLNLIVENSSSVSLILRVFISGNKKLLSMRGLSGRKFIIIESRERFVILVIV